MEPNTTGIKRDEEGRILPGSAPLNPAGRPVGSISIIAKIKKKFEEDPTLFDSYVAEVLTDPKLRQEIIRQLDGAPRQNIGIDGGADGLPVQIQSMKELSNDDLERIARGG